MRYICLVQHFLFSIVSFRFFTGIIEKQSLENGEQNEAKS